MSDTATVSTADQKIRADEYDVRLTVTRETTDPDGHTRYSYVIADHTTGEVLHTGDDITTGAWMDHGPTQALETLAAFLSAAAESYPDGENADLFPPHICERAQMVSEELSCIIFEINDETSPISFDQ